MPRSNPPQFRKTLLALAIITAWWGIWHIVSGLSLALFWSKRDPRRYPRFAHRHH